MAPRRSFNTSLKDISATQLLFTLLFLFHAQALGDGFMSFVKGFPVFHWLWISFMAWGISGSKATNKFGKRWSRGVIFLSIALVAACLFLLVISISLIGRLDITASYPGLVILIATLAMYPISLVVHGLVIRGNYRQIDPAMTDGQLVLRLLFYPWGIWTIQSNLNRAERLLGRKKAT